MNVILATTSSFGTASPDALARLEQAGYAVAVNPFGRKLTEGELAGLLAEHRPVGLLAGTEPVTGAVIRGAASHLKAIARVGIGWDNVDHAAAAEAGIPVSRTEGVLDQSVAELTLGMMLSALRKIAWQDRDIRAGQWKKRMGGLLEGKTVGVIGCGAIGQKVGALCRAFGAAVLGTDVSDVSPEGVEMCTLDDLLARADIVSVHASGSCCLLDGARLDLCRPGAILVNTARGGMIDEAALAERLEDGRIGCACLDVFGQEPYTGLLARLDNTVLTPHIGSYALEARIAMELKAVDNLLRALEG